MRRYLPLITGLLGIGLLVWLLLGGGGDSGGEPEPWGPIYEPPPDPGALSSPGLRASRPRENRTEPAPTPEPSGYRALTYGAIRVLPVDADGRVLPADEVTVHVRPGKLAWPAQPLGRRARGEGTWFFERVPAGKVRVVVEGNKVLRTEQLVTLATGETQDVRLVARAGGSIHYRVKLLNGEAPREVTLALKDVRGQLIAAEYAVRTRTVYTSPRRERTITQGPDGWILNLKPGSYRLRVESERDVDESDVVVEAGQVSELAVELRD